MSDNISRCAGCGAEIQWKITPAGKRMPLDVEPRKEPEAGTYLVHHERCRPAQPMFDTEGPFFMNHWATCPDRELFRKSPAGNAKGWVS